MKLDFSKVLREQAEKIQDENVARLLAGQTVAGGGVAPRKDEPAGTPGVRTGELLRALSRRDNVRVGPLWLRVTVGRDQLVKWVVFNAGRTRRGTQPARPVSGISEARYAEVATEVARELKAQLVRALRARAKS